MAMWTEGKIKSQWEQRCLRPRRRVLDVSVEEATPDGAHVQAAEYVQVALDEGAVTRTAVLMFVVVRALPGGALVCGIIDPERIAAVAGGAPDKERLVGRAGGGLADANRQRGMYDRQSCPRGTSVGRERQAVGTVLAVRSPALRLVQRGPQ